MGESHMVKVADGIVKVYRTNGECERVICAGAVSAELKEDEIIVAMQGGKKKIYSIRGFFKRNA